MKRLLEEFRKLPDYRKNKVRYTNPSEILFLSLLAVLSGANSFEDMALWMKERKREIAKLLDRAFKAPAYTTIRNTYNGMDIEAIERLQREWVEGISSDNQGLTIIATDGKTMRGSKSKEMNEKARHIVSLFLTESKLTLTQNQVDQKSNEIPALIALLDNLNLKNCVITMDAMHTQKKTLAKIIKKGHHYVAQVKANSKDLLQWVDFNSNTSNPIDEYISYDHNTHGRYEERVCKIYDDLYQITENWKSVKRVITITSSTLSYGKHSIETHRYISSLDVDAKTFLHIIRSHWKIENSLHYVKDVSFEEDACRTRTGQIPFMQTMLRSLAINVINLNKFSNIKQARKVFAWNPYKLFSLNSYFGSS